MGLKEFVAENVGVEVIPVGALENAMNLRFMSLIRNHIKSLADHTFNGTSKLENLWLSNNNISDIEPMSFFGLASLKELKLSGNLIKELNADLFIFSPLLETFHVDNNWLERVPTKLFMQNEKIKNLKFNKNSLMEFDVQLSHDTLCYLNVDNNSISLFQLKVHHIHQMSDWNENCEVSGIHASHNSINTFFITEGFLVPQLFLDDNLLTETSGIANIHGLKKLYISSNPLKQSLIKDLGKIQAAKTLRVLSLQNLTLSNIDTNLVSALTNLEELDLSNNHIDYINPTAFRAPLPNLFKLNLAGNNIKDLAVDQLVVQFPGLVQIDLRDNKWKCNRLQKIIDELLSRNVSLSTSAKNQEADDDNIKGVNCKN